MRDLPSAREVELFDRQVVVPVLDVLAAVEPRVRGRSARELLVGTAQAESNLLHGLQVPNGPARSRFQFEPQAIDLMLRWLQRGHNGRFASALELLLPGFALGAVADPKWLHDHVAWNDFFACGLARLLYFSWPDPLAAAGDWGGHARAWKKMYNSELGKGTPEKFLERNRSVIAYFKSVKD